MLASINHDRNRANWLHLSVVLLVSAMWLLTGTTSPAEQEPAPATKRLVAHEEFVKELARDFEPMPADCLKRVIRNPDNLRAVCAAKRGNKSVLYLDGALGPEFDEWYPGATVFSPDGERLVCKVRRGTGVFIIVDGKEQGPFRLVGVAVFSPDSKRLAYLVAKDKNTWVAVVDGVEQTPMRSIDLPVFSPESKHLAYPAQKDKNTMVMVVDGAEQGAFRLVGVGVPVFSPDGNRLAYTATKDNNQRVVVVDGVEQAPYQSVTRPVFSPDSNRVVYLAEKNKDTWVAVVDGVEHPPMRSIYLPVFSPDSKHLAYSAQKDKNTAVMVVDGAEQGPFRLVAVPVFSPDGKHLAYAADLSSRWSNKIGLVVDGQVRSTEYSSIANVQFSPDSKRLAYVGCTKTCEAVIDDKKGSPFEIVGPVLFSEDSQHFAYGAAGVGWFHAPTTMVSDQQVWAVEHGSVVRKADPREGLIGFLVEKALPFADASLVESVLPRPLISANGKIVAWIERDRPKWERMVVNGRKGPDSESVVAFPGFSPDGEHFAYLRRFSLQGRDKEVVVLDEREGKPYDAVVAQPRFTGNSTLVFTGIDGRRVFRVTQSIE